MRNLGLSANQLVTLPGAGDFQLLRIESAPEPAALGVPRRAPDQAIMDADGAGGSRMVVVPDPAQQESLARENVPDPLAGEQTWPTDNVRAPRSILVCCGARCLSYMVCRVPEQTPVLCQSLCQLVQCLP